MMGFSSAWMGLTSGTAGNPLKIVLYVVTTRPAVSLRAGYVMATQTVLTKKMNKDVLVKNVAHLNLDVRMANAYLILCIVMGTETAWTTQMKKAVLFPGPCSAPQGR